MIDFKDKIAEETSKVLELTKEELKEYIEIPKDTKMGDYALPCFKLAKEMKKSPVIIANEIKEKIEMQQGAPNRCILFFHFFWVLLQFRRSRRVSFFADAENFAELRRIYYTCFFPS